MNGWKQKKDGSGRKKITAARKTSAVIPKDGVLGKQSFLIQNSQKRFQGPISMKKKERKKEKKKKRNEKESKEEKKRFPQKCTPNWPGRW